MIPHIGSEKKAKLFFFGMLGWVIRSSGFIASLTHHSIPDIMVLETEEDLRGPVHAAFFSPFDWSMESHRHTPHFLTS
ncbi:uncharacterized protein P884DRAFT_254028 [Thermothelomyces heterothallicus CBS 202.75]|uniref:uncharacterized protein n=1 Tax=Thermothelomyces heterothallicus CBS 202.75 TaxID=1149848 RepID=UPI003743A1DA